MVRFAATALEESSTRPQQETTHPPQFLHVKEQPKSSQLSPRVTTEDIQNIANAIFEKKGRGITFKDLICGKHKRVDTAKQAKNILHYHKKRGTLYTNPSITIPQQYFLSKADAEESVRYYKNNTKVTNSKDKSSTHPHPTGVRAFPTDLTTVIDERKADNLAEALDRLAEDTGGKLPIGFHNIRIHLALPPEYASEAYNERLAHVRESNTREKSKRVNAVIDGFKVELLFYPKGKVVIMVPCSDRPFPIHLDSPEQVTSDFNSFVAQIRRIIVTHLSDHRGRIVPPIHSSAWRLVHGDLNWDIPTTMLSYLGMDGIQITKASDAILRIYRKRVRGERYVRVEEGVHRFTKDVKGGFDNSVGFSIIEAAKRAQKQLLPTPTPAPSPPKSHHQERIQNLSARL